MPDNQFRNRPYFVAAHESPHGPNAKCRNVRVEFRSQGMSGPYSEQRETDVDDPKRPLHNTCCRFPGYKPIAMTSTHCE